MNALLIVSLNVLLLISGQILWKTALLRHPLNQAEDLPRLFMHPYVLLGLLLYAMATVVWLYALSRFDLSRVYPLQATAYILGAFAGLVVFKELISAQQWAGLGLIAAGVCLTAFK